MAKQRWQALLCLRAAAQTTPINSPRYPFMESISIIVSYDMYEINNNATPPWTIQKVTAWQTDFRDGGWGKGMMTEVYVR